MILRRSKDEDVDLTGVVVRSFRGPATLAGLMPSGFGVHFSETPPDEYFRLLATL